MQREKMKKTAKMILKETGEDEFGRKTFVSITGHPYVLVDDVIHTVTLDGEPECPVSNDNGDRLTMKGVKICD